MTARCRNVVRFPSTWSREKRRRAKDECDGNSMARYHVWRSIGLLSEVDQLLTEVLHAVESEWGKRNVGPDRLPEVMEACFDDERWGPKVLELALCLVGR